MEEYKGLSHDEITDLLKKKFFSGKYQDFWSLFCCEMAPFFCSEKIKFDWKDKFFSKKLIEDFFCHDLRSVRDILVRKNCVFFQNQGKIFADSMEFFCRIVSYYNYGLRTVSLMVVIAILILASYYLLNDKKYDPKVFGLLPSLVEESLQNFYESSCVFICSDELNSQQCKKCPAMKYGSYNFNIAELIEFEYLK